MRLHRIVVAFAFLIACVHMCPAATAAPPSTRPAKEAGGATLAVFDLKGPITESQAGDDLFAFDMQPVPLRELTKRIRAAGDDGNVKAVVLLADHVMAGRAQVEELRQAIKEVRAKDKDVYVHTDVMTMGDYLLFSGASRVSVSPTGIVLVSGLHGEQPYLRGLLDKIGVKPDFMHIGAYKSAVELFTRTGPSPESDEMHNWLFDSIYNNSVQLIADGRKVDADKAKKWIDDALYTAEAAKDAGLIDAVEHRQEFDAMLKKKYGDAVTYDRKYGEKKKPQLDFSSPFAIFQIFGEMMRGKQETEPGKPAVGIVYVDGMIMTGTSHPSLFGGGEGAYSSDIRKALDKAGRDDSIKAVVLRIDSGGGSATASEIILDATRRVKATGKPYVVSMGDVAGSGGYYVAMAADTIFADESTITGSIGVLSGKLVTNDMWKKIGITWKSYDRGANANMFASDNLWTEPQRQRMQQFMDDVYGVFKKHVTDIRGDKLKKPIDEIAGGRVYTGKQALELGLVDKIGTLSDAVAFAADKAKLTPGEYDVRSVPEPKNFIEKLIEKSSGGDDEENRWIATGAGHASSSLVDLAMPYVQNLDPMRVRAIRTALEKLQLLDKEGVLLVMPEGFVFN